MGGKKHDVGTEYHFRNIQIFIVQNNFIIKSMKERTQNKLDQQSNSHIYNAFLLYCSSCSMTDGAWFMPELRLLWSMKSEKRAKSDSSRNNYKKKAVEK